MEVIKRFDQNKKLVHIKNLNHGPRDVVNGHMGTQLTKLNEAIS
jgi:hypothetical protein